MKNNNNNNNMNKMDLIVKLLVELKEDFEKNKMNKDEKIRFNNFIYDVEDLLNNEDDVGL
jgi:hypothetical protein